MSGPLDGTVRVLDLSERSPAAAIAGMVLADLGAEVIRVEPQNGDPMRALPGSRVWLRGQKSVTIADGQVANGQWDALRASADVIMTTAQPWSSKPAGLLNGYPNDPRQILAVLTSHPRSIDEVKGPRHGAENPVCGELIEAEYGFTHLQEGWREGPTFLGWPLATCGAAWLFQIGILGALLDLARFGRGQIVTTSVFDGAAILASARFVSGKLAERMFTGTRISTRGRPMRFIISLFECADGNWIQVHTGPRGAFDRLMKLVGRNDLVTNSNDARVLATPLDPAIVKEIWPHLDRTFKSQPADYWRELLSANDVACMPALKAGEVLWLKQLEENGQVDIEPDGHRQLGKIVKYRRTPITPGREIPAPGQHNAMLFAEGNGRARNGERSGNGDAGRPANADNAHRVGPLDGMLALDFGLHLAGPFANRMYSDLGARVIKVEEYTGDPVRGPHLDIFLPCNRGKESIALDLKTEEGRRILYDLVKRADIIHNNMRDGAMDRIGMGYETVCKLNPRIVFCHSSGYGNQGPWSRLPTFEPLHSALSGILRRTGGENNPPDHYLTHMDIGCGLTATACVLAALIERERSGLGQYLEVPQIGTALLAMSDVHGYKDHISETFPLDHKQRGHAPTNAMYRTRDGWIVIACYSDVEWNGVKIATRAHSRPAVAWLCTGASGATWRKQNRAGNRSCLVAFD